MTPELTRVATLVESPPPIGSPQVTTRPFFFKAAKAYPDENTAYRGVIQLSNYTLLAIYILYRTFTFDLTSCATELKSPPDEAEPQATADPSFFTAQNARCVLDIDITPDRRLYCSK